MLANVICSCWPADYKSAPKATIVAKAPSNFEEIRRVAHCRASASAPDLAQMRLRTGLSYSGVWWSSDSKVSNDTTGRNINIFAKFLFLPYSGSKMAPGHRDTDEKRLFTIIRISHPVSAGEWNSPRIKNVANVISGIPTCWYCSLPTDQLTAGAQHFR